MTKETNTMNTASGSSSDCDTDLSSDCDTDSLSDYDPKDTIESSAVEHEPSFGGTESMSMAFMEGASLPDATLSTKIAKGSGKKRAESSMERSATTSVMGSLIGQSECSSDIEQVGDSSADSKSPTQHMQPLGRIKRIRGGIASYIRIAAVMSFGSPFVFISVATAFAASISLVITGCVIGGKDVNFPSIFAKDPAYIYSGYGILAFCILSTIALAIMLSLNLYFFLNKQDFISRYQVTKETFSTEFKLISEFLDLVVKTKDTISDIKSSFADIVSSQCAIQDDDLAKALSEKIKNKAIEMGLLTIMHKILASMHNTILLTQKILTEIIEEIAGESILAKSVEEMGQPKYISISNRTAINNSILAIQKSLETLLKFMKQKPEEEKVFKETGDVRDFIVNFYNISYKVVDSIILEMKEIVRVSPLRLSGVLKSSHHRDQLQKQFGASSLLDNLLTQCCKVEFVKLFLGIAETTPPSEALAEAGAEQITAQSPSILAA